MINILEAMEGTVRGNKSHGFRTDSMYEHYVLPIATPAR